MPKITMLGAGSAFTGKLARDVILTPGLAFDRTGGRLGRGAGFYDRFLERAKLSTSAPVLGVCFAEQLVDRVPADTHDVGVGMLVTQEGVFPTG